MTNLFDRERSREKIAAFRQIAAEVEAEVSAALAEIDRKCNLYEQIAREWLGEATDEG